MPPKNLFLPRAAFDMLRFCQMRSLGCGASSNWALWRRLPRSVLATMWAYGTDSCERERGQISESCIES